MESEMTIRDVLSVTVNLLKGVMIPAEYAESIGVPVSRSISNLNECINVIKQIEEKMEEKEDGREADSE